MSCTTQCPKLGATRAAHCSVCHLTFSGVRYFDDHRKGRQCKKPASLGLTEKDGVWAMWGSLFDKKWWAEP